MNFMIPKNYKFKPKLFGLIDYQTAILNGIWAVILYSLINALIHTLSTKIYVFIGGYLPFLLFSIIGIGHENIVSVVTYIFKFYTKQNLYLYKKI